MTAKRTSAFQRNPALEKLLGQMNTALAKAEPPDTDTPALPPLFILGTPRSGTTYCMQWLAESGAFSYPSNLIARFWQSPYIGAVCQQMLTDPAFDFRGEFSDLSFDAIEHRSELGKTRGVLSPNEFWYFWRAIFPGDQDIGIDLSQATADQYRTFTRRLGAFAGVRGKPVATKGMIVNHQIDAFAAGVPNALFLHLDRDPVDAAWSLLRSRERMHGDQNIWYSFKTPNRAELEKLPAPQQVMGQIETIRQDLGRHLSDLPENRWLKLGYSELCSDPTQAFEKLRRLYADNGVTLDGASTLPPTHVSKPDIPAEIRHAFSEVRMS